MAYSTHANADQDLPLTNVGGRDLSQDQRMELDLLRSVKDHGFHSASPNKEGQTPGRVRSAGRLQAGGEDRSVRTADPTSFEITLADVAGFVEIDLAAINVLFQRKRALVASSVWPPKLALVEQYPMLERLDETVPAENR